MQSSLQMLVDRNFYWYGYLAEFTRSIGVELPLFPNIGVFTRKPRKGWTLGYYESAKHLVAYNYWFLQSQPEKEVDLTICHEMCHCFQRRIFSHSKRPWHEWCSHGELFYFLFVTICKQDPRTVLDGKPVDKLLQAAEQMKVKLPAWLYLTDDLKDTIGLFHEVQDLNLRSEQAGFPTLRTRKAGRVLHEGDEEGEGSNGIVE